MLKSPMFVAVAFVFVSSLQSVVVADDHGDEKGA